MNTDELFTTNPELIRVINRLMLSYPGQHAFKKPQVLDASGGILGVYPAMLYKYFLNAEHRIGHGLYSLDAEINYVQENFGVAHSEEKDNSIVEEEQPQQMNMAVPKMVYSNHEPVEQNRNKMPDVSHKVNDCFVPIKDPSFVPWGNFSDIKAIIKSGEFFPVFISGMSGNGKTFSVEQCCAQLKREYIRVQINSDTTEADLIGSYTLVDGNTVWQDGPITVAAKEGAICLIDELDRGSTSLFATQGVLEGKPFLIKQTGELVTPKAGFNVIATGNTKGAGAGPNDNRYAFARIIDEALLERFPVDLEQEFPKRDILQKMLDTYVDSHASLFSSKKAVENVKSFTEDLSAWGEIINTSFSEDAVEETISVRRLVHILKTFGIFNGNALKAIKLCINRFDPVNREAFIDLYRKVSKIDVFSADETSETDKVESLRLIENND